eukprot:TRINITY_DN12075_c0_g1_i1.p1 TRINITY_DN12075_c0_g1~~TRINITY_DN12075_c0_g1_i1.p1  ORF type:complete len:503 (-),score=59.46 TRINITY_DN12075_c0_g1_i1:24-1469(-)
MEVEETNVTPPLRLDKDILDRAKYVPLRLSEEERTALTILNCALEISEYTNNVDVASSMYRYYWNTTVSKKTHVMQVQLKDFLSYILGVKVASDIVEGKKLVDESDLKSHEGFIQNILEVGRRFKILNPEKMRTTYGKLIHIMQDAVSPGVISLDVKADIKTVHKFLTEKKALSLLEDDMLIDATLCVVSNNADDISSQTQIKSSARNHIIKKYESDNLTKEDIILCLDSISDSTSYLASNRYPVDKMIHFLKKYFDPNNEESDELSLQISSGSGGSCLSHSHRTQYRFVHQSLQLWREIQHEMYYLWLCAENDLLDEDNSYDLTDTGQGLQRLQEAPTVSKAMSRILRTVQSRLDSWVGLSVVHLGDRDVPNALVFIDKYTQVPRILAPIVQTIDRIKDLEKDPKVNIFLEQYGGADNVIKSILCDYFKHGFDGSGDDGGSCIDGRLTSSWNWCSKIEKKPYYPVFLLTGFYGFDGSFKK